MFLLEDAFQLCLGRSDLFCLYGLGDILQINVVDEELLVYKVKRPDIIRKGYLCFRTSALIGLSDEASRIK